MHEAYIQEAKEFYKTICKRRDNDDWYLEKISIQNPNDCITNDDFRYLMALALNPFIDDAKAKLLCEESYFCRVCLLINPSTSKFIINHILEMYLSERCDRDVEQLIKAMKKRIPNHIINNAVLYETIYRSIFKDS